MANPTTYLGSTKPTSEHDENKVASYNTVLDDVDSAIAGLVEVAITTADVTLTRAQALNKVFKLTGVLTGNRVLKFPITGGTSRQFTVWNATTGAFTATVKTTHASSTGIAVTQTEKQLLFHDLVSVYAATASAGSGDMLLGTAQTNTAKKTFNNQTLALVGAAGLPGTCTLGDFAVNTTGNGYYRCTATNTWSEIFVSGVSLVNLTSNVTATLPIANGGTANTTLAYTTLTDGATITWTVAGIVNNAVVTLGGNRTLAFSGLVAGMSGTLIVKQDATGTRTLTLPAASKVINGGAGAITLTTTASAIDILAWTYDGTSSFWSFGKNYT